MYSQVTQGGVTQGRVTQGRVVLPVFPRHKTAGASRKSSGGTQRGTRKYQDVGITINICFKIRQACNVFLPSEAENSMD